VPKSRAKLIKLRPCGGKAVHTALCGGGGRLSGRRSGRAAAVCAACSAVGALRSVRACVWPSNRLGPSRPVLRSRNVTQRNFLVIDGPSPRPLILPHAAVLACSPAAFNKLFIGCHRRFCIQFYYCLADLTHGLAKSLAITAR